ncbi:MAG TPA: hypothetical protein DIW43_16140 [Spongiibacteraceae bacterium]|nr:hypothetical protein [Spongiibacteraceae bacterium]
MQLDKQVISPIRRLRVLQLSRWLFDSEYGGIQAYLATFPRILPSSQYELLYAALMPGERPRYAASSVYLGRSVRSKVVNAILLRRWLAKALGDIDIVHVHGVTDWHFIVGSLLCWYSRVPFIVTPSGGLLPESMAVTVRRRLVSSIFFSLCGRFLLRKAYAVIATSQREMDCSLRLDRKIPVLTIPHGVSIPAMPRHAKPDGAGALRVIFLGRIDLIKSIPTLLEALSLLRKRGLRVQLDVLGRGAEDYVGSLVSMASDLGVAEQIVWHGHIVGDEKRQLLVRADVLVLPSLSENFGYAAAEAMAEGIPVVVSDHVGLASYVAEHDAGTIFRHKDSVGLAEALQEYSSGRVVERRGMNAYLLACKEFSLEKMGERLGGLYAKAAG